MADDCFHSITTKTWSFLSKKTDRNLKISIQSSMSKIIFRPWNQFIFIYFVQIQRKKIGSFHNDKPWTTIKWMTWIKQQQQQVVQNNHHNRDIYIRYTVIHKMNNLSETNWLPMTKNNMKNKEKNFFLWFIESKSQQTKKMSMSKHNFIGLLFWVLKFFFWVKKILSITNEAKPQNHTTIIIWNWIWSKEKKTWNGMVNECGW